MHKARLSRAVWGLAAVGGSRRLGVRGGWGLAVVGGSRRLGDGDVTVLTGAPEIHQTESGTL